MAPTVSVVIPVYNWEAYLTEQSTASLARALPTAIDVTQNEVQPPNYWESKAFASTTRDPYYRPGRRSGAKISIAG